MNAWVSLFLAIITEVVGTAALKASDQFTRLWPSLLVVIGYVLSFYFLAVALKYIPVGVAYAIWSGVGTVMIALIGVWLFRQHLDLAAIIGILLIIAGVLVLNLLSHTTVHG